MVEAPKVYCPKEDRMVPIWFCLGSYIQQRPKCPELLEAKITRGYAEVKCKAQKPKKKEEKEKESMGCP